MAPDYQRTWAVEHRPGPMRTSPTMGGVVKDNFGRLWEVLPGNFHVNATGTTYAVLNWRTGTITTVRGDPERCAWPNEQDALNKEEVSIYRASRKSS